MAKDKQTKRQTDDKKIAVAAQIKDDARAKISENKKIIECKDKLCPFHGENALRLRGRVFEGEVIKKLKGRLTIEFERTLYVPKFERYEKRRTKLHARLPDCLDNEISVGDYIQIGETRPISKMIHFVVVKKIRTKQEKIVK